MYRTASPSMATEGSTPTTSDARPHSANAAQNIPVPAPISTTTGAGRGAHAPITSAQTRSAPSGISFPT